MANPFLAVRRAMKSRVGVYTPEEKQALFNEYRDSLTGLKAGLALSTTAFTESLKDRMVDYHGFKDTAAPGTLKFYKKLIANNKDAAYVREQINKALEPTDAFTAAQKKYHESIEDINRLVAKIPEKYKVEVFIGIMTDIRDDALNVIKDQQAHEIQLLEAQFNQESSTELNQESFTFTESFKKMLGYSEADCNAIQKNMLADLNAAHKKQMATFEQSTSQALTAIHQASAQQNGELLFLANLYKNNEVMRKQMDSTLNAEKNKAPASGEVDPILQTTDNKNVNKITLTGIKLNDFSVIESVTGKQITRTENGGYALEFGKYIFNPLYYLSPKDNVMMDIRTLVEATKAAGAKGITMNVNASDPDLANIRAKQCYKACIESGYAPKDIKMIVNGKELKPEEIFTTEAHVLQSLQKRSPQIIKQHEALLSKPSNSNKDEITAAKAAMVAIRDEDNPAVADSQQTAENQSPSADINFGNN